MSVINTLPIMHKLSEMSKHQLGEKVVKVHREMICNVLKVYFPKVSLEEIHFELLINGLFDPIESIEIEEVVEALEEKKILETAQIEFERIKSLWMGPDVPIYIYPLTKYRPTIEGIEVKKNGVAYRGVLFLFISSEIKEDELKALLAHEYHHICRQSFLNKKPQQIALIDSLIIEGMAEYAVEELYGEHWLSPWTKRYSQEEAKLYWETHFVPNLQLKGVNNHHPFLYGDTYEGLPAWIGYCIGYQIVNSFLKTSGTISQHLLCQIPTNEILRNSFYK